jgi:hypothetical protein
MNTKTTGPDTGFPTGKETMKQISSSLAAFLLVLVLLPAGASASEWWILGTVKGKKIKEKAVPVHLVRIDDAGETVVSRTATNKSGQYAFSDPGDGLPPKAYKVVLKVSPELSIDVSLEEVEPRGWMPAIIPPVTVYW